MAELGNNWCGAQEAVVAAANTSCAWPRGHVITYRIDDKLDEFSDTEFAQIMEDSWTVWEAKSGVRVEPTTGHHANVVVTKRVRDGVGGILAEAQLPCGNVHAGSTLFVWFDVSEHWVNAENPAARNMDLLRVARHEFGHSLGIGHIQHTVALMNPTVSQVRTILAADIQEAVDRYGDPSTTPAPGGGTPQPDICDLLLTELTKRLSTDDAKRHARLAAQHLGKALEE